MLRARVARVAAQARPVARLPSRRYASSAEKATETIKHAASRGGDTTWIIGSGLIFIPTVIYLTSPPHKKDHVEHYKERHQTREAQRQATEDYYEDHDDPEDEVADHVGPAGEGKDHGDGDKHLRSKSEADHTGRQKVTTEPGYMRASADKMAQAQKDSTKGQSDPKASVAAHKTREMDKKAGNKPKDDPKAKIEVREENKTDEEKSDEEEEKEEE
ncbi:uncharacterized protein L969DRAFT_100961 [Mixia osmundae IAM 14324]|uniref:Uncharacterized protein n=1 Tax=Mixia osmundae (strain CBS 9802 / IAM 14324 / JCM 22182 / KY 12970) TaxID=764103 RepID=G7E334_MIXOS|nr:uncharacterized protein L969DRAFT_100961 [Mixia osmundae IAM 14324]KEI42496.1 hypothetical protein L969DRAFT_100961 [Mixia osmundae IAM 14324]GAA97215.1 hypothetical protein E5Q_03891 [Mixia osmundae IAM 14324]